MVSQARLARYYALAVVGSVLAFALVYDAGMTAFEGRPRTFLEALEVVLQTFTTTGYGQDAPWESTAMTLLVIAMHAAGLLLIFAAFPVLIVPLVEDALSTTPPTARPDLSDHVVLCTFSPRTPALIDEFDARDVPYVVVDPDRETAVDGHEAGHEVVHGDPEAVATLRDVAVSDARAVVADGDDRVDLSVIMAAEEAAPDVPVYSVVEEADLAPYHDHAGADHVFSPRELLGRGLARKVHTSVDADLDGALDPGEHLEVGELPVQPGSELQGQRFAEAGIEERTGVRVIGAWSRGEFRTPPFPDLRLDEHTALLVVGSDPALAGLEHLTLSSVRAHRRGEVVVAGYGVVGSTVAEILAREDVPQTVVDLTDHPGVDVVGDVTDKRTLRKAGAGDARTVVLALDDDTTTLLASFVVRDLAPDVELVVRTEDAENVRKLYRAGADYVLSLSSVTARLLASRLVSGEEFVAADRSVEVVRVPAGSLDTDSLGDLAVRERTGCTVVAVEHRDGRADADVGPHTRLRPSDHLVVAGLDRDVDRFRETYC
jgi:Trk K+ transport system NAD-binding subunit